ncbi:hypothetical protein GPECTOR_130g574 [Gonium pectorale]|uniref:Protein kinase domain-containing protein n=1 Tax=Gonium pectorale TaxID=33097 RepID=A0A150FYB5_GONPE|nr:hypothetical protein GPECTOR_130g574 [Gonium pectorale]|eukprot:KXZ42613.1 hypothetical protein GPECTOR_130g574 [Gonium pectorale]
MPLCRAAYGSYPAPQPDGGRGPTGALAAPGNGVFVLMLLCSILFLADCVLHLPGCSSLYLNHARPHWWQFVTHLFCHGNFAHLSGNLFNLCVFGKMVEETEGAGGVILVFLICGIGAALASLLLLPATSNGHITVSVGASGAIFGLFAVSVLTRLRWNLKQLLEAAVLGQFVVRQVLEEAKHQVTGGLMVGGLAVSHAAHLAGAAGIGGQSPAPAPSPAPQPSPLPSPPRPAETFLAQTGSPDAPDADSGADHVDTILQLTGLTRRDSCSHLSAAFLDLLDSGSGVWSRNQLCYLQEQPAQPQPQGAGALPSSAQGLQHFALSAVLPSPTAAETVLRRLGRQRGADIQTFLISAGVPCGRELVATTLTGDPDAATPLTMYTYSCTGAVSVAGARPRALPALCCEAAPPPKRPRPPHPPPLLPPWLPQQPPAAALRLAGSSGGGGSSVAKLSTYSTELDSPLALSRPSQRPSTRPPPSPAKVKIAQPQLTLFVMTEPHRLSCAKLVAACETLSQPYGLSGGNFTCRASNDPTAPHAALYGSEVPYMVVAVEWRQRQFSRELRRLNASLTSSVQVFASLGLVPCDTEIRAMLLGASGSVQRHDSFGCLGTFPAAYNAQLVQQGLHGAAAAGETSLEFSSSGSTSSGSEESMRGRWAVTLPSAALGAGQGRSLAAILPAGDSVAIVRTVSPPFRAAQPARAAGAPTDAVAAGDEDCFEAMDVFRNAAAAYLCLSNPGSAAPSAPGGLVAAAAANAPPPGYSQPWQRYGPGTAVPGTAPDDGLPQLPAPPPPAPLPPYPPARDRAGCVDEAREVTLMELFNQSPLAGAFLATPPGSEGGAPPSPPSQQRAAAPAQQSAVQGSPAAALERLSVQLALNIDRLSRRLEVQAEASGTGTLAPAAVAPVGFAEPPQLPQPQQGGSGRPKLPLTGPGLDISPRELRIHTDGLLGAGAFGSVYRGSYRGQPVAIKVLHHLTLAVAAGGPAGLGGASSSLQDRDVESFRQEIAILCNLQHPNIVRVLGGCAHAGHPFLVMELMPRCLHNVIHSATERLGLGEALRIATDVARGLAHLHPAIVHRDLKPANILMDSAGTSKISDFGLAR